MLLVNEMLQDASLASLGSEYEAKEATAYVRAVKPHFQILWLVPTRPVHSHPPNFGASPEKIKPTQKLQAKLEIRPLRDLELGDSANPHDDDHPANPQQWPATEYSTAVATGTFSP